MSGDGRGVWGSVAPLCPLLLLASSATTRFFFLLKTSSAATNRLWESRTSAAPPSSWSQPEQGWICRFPRHHDDSSVFCCLVWANWPTKFCAWQRKSPPVCGSSCKAELMFRTKAVRPPLSGWTRGRRFYGTGWHKVRRGGRRRPCPWKPVRTMTGLIKWETRRCQTWRLQGHVYFVSLPTASREHQKVLQARNHHPLPAHPADDRKCRKLLSFYRR